MRTGENLAWRSRGAAPRMIARLVFPAIVGCVLTLLSARCAQGRVRALQELAACIRDKQRCVGWTGCWAGWAGLDWVLGWAGLC